MNPKPTLFVTGGGMRRIDEVFQPSSVTATPLPFELEPFPGYADIRETAQGTFLARSREGGELVVLRLLPTLNMGESGHSQRYSSNIDLATKFRHADIASVFGLSARRDGQAFLVRQHIAGVPFDVYAQGQALGQASPPSLAVVIALFVRVCHAVHAAHSSGVIHGDIKPANVLIDSSGTPHLLDFGVGLSPRSDQTNDLLALGRILFDALRLRSTPPDAPLAELARRAISRGPDRFSSAEELAAALEECMSSEPPQPVLRNASHGMIPWLREQIAEPRHLLTVGGIVGLITGTYLAVPATQAIVQSGSGSLSTPIVAAVNSGWMFQLWSCAALILPLVMGVLAVRRAKARTLRGACIAGITTGFIAGCAAWLMGAGGFVGTAINLGSAREASALIAALPGRSTFTVTTSFDLSANHPQESLLAMHPELSETPEHARTDAIHTRLIADLRSGAYRAGWLSPILPLVLGITLGLVGANAGFMAMQLRRSRFEQVLAYLELSLPCQIGLVILVSAIISIAAGVTNARSLIVAPAILPLAASIFIAVRTEVPSFVRLGCYLAGSIFFFRMAGQPLPLWAEMPTYLVSLASLIWLVASTNRAQQSTAQ